MTSLGSSRAAAARESPSRQCREGVGKRRENPVRDCTIAQRLIGATLLLAPIWLSASDCIPIQEAAQHVGETKCVTGKVLRVKVGPRGVHFLDFCEDQVACPFSVVVFSRDLKDVGDVRRLAGRRIEIQGAVKAYDGRPEIILRRISQIAGGAAMIPALPKNYDVENRGHFSPGRLYPSKKPAKTKATVPPTSVYGDVEGEDPP